MLGAQAGSDEDHWTHWSFTSHPESPVDLCFSLVHVPSANTEEEGFMTYTAARHQGAIKMSSCLGVYTYGARCRTCQHTLMSSKQKVCVEVETQLKCPGNKCESI